MLRLEQSYSRKSEISAWRVRSGLLRAAAVVAGQIEKKAEGTAFLDWFQGWFTGLAEKYNKREIRRILPK